MIKKNIDTFTTVDESPMINNNNVQDKIQQSSIPGKFWTHEGSIVGADLMDYHDSVG